MNYAEQTRFLSRYRIAAALGAAAVALVAGAAFASDAVAGTYGRAAAIVLGLATLYCLCYLPLYLWLSVERRKRFVWLVRVRWIGVALGALGAAPALGSAPAAAVWAFLVAVAAGGNVAGRALVRRAEGDAARFVAVPLLACDLAVWLGAVVFLGPSPLVASVWLAGLATIYALVAAPVGQLVALAAVAAATALGLFAPASATYATALLPVVAGAVALMLARLVARQQRANEADTVAELAAFADAEPVEAESLLATATGALAASWNAAPPTSPEAVSRWYSENSHLYLYDLAQFHLAYKHIAFMRDVIALARGRVLDHGAGIGDLALELARRGHETTYVDVDGETKEFARWKAAGENLRVRFASDLDGVDGPFDTIVSLDVLEHLPEPVPVVEALLDRLAPGGRIVMTSYFGPTKAHPMHFDHDVDLRAIFAARGLRDAKPLAMRIWRSEFMRKGNVLVFDRPSS